MTPKAKPRRYCDQCGRACESTDVSCPHCAHDFEPRCEGCTVSRIAESTIRFRAEYGLQLCTYCAEDYEQAPVRLRLLALAELGTALVAATESVPEGEALDISVVRPADSPLVFDVYITAHNGATLEVNAHTLALASILSARLLPGGVPL